LVVTPEQHHLLSRLSLLQGRSQASYVRNLIDLATPGLKAIAQYLEDARDRELEYDEDMRRQLDEDLADALTAADAELDEEELQLSLLNYPGDQDASGDDVAPAPSGAREDAATPPDAHSPPYSNTGVRNPDGNVHHLSSKQRNVG